MLPLAPIIMGITKIIDKVVPDADARAKAKELLEGQEFQGVLSLALAQIDLNKIEASSESLFKSGWRPFIGWTCGLALCYQFLLRPLLGYLIELSAWGLEKDLATMPHLISLNLETLMTLLFGMLGLGVQRSIDKRGIAKRAIATNDRAAATGDIEFPFPSEQRR